MLEMSEQSKRESLASELADIFYRQQAIVDSNKVISSFYSDDEIPLFESMMREDEKNLRMIDTVLNNFGLRVQPRSCTRRFTEMSLSLITDPTSLALEKLDAYSLLKQNQAMGGHLVHKATHLA